MRNGRNASRLRDRGRILGKDRYIDARQEDTRQVLANQIWRSCTYGGFYIGAPIQVTAEDKKVRAEIFNKNPNRKAAIMKIINVGRSIGFKNRQE